MTDANQFYETFMTASIPSSQVLQCVANGFLFDRTSYSNRIDSCNHVVQHIRYLIIIISDNIGKIK